MYKSRAMREKEQKEKEQKEKELKERQIREEEEKKIKYQQQQEEKMREMVRQELKSESPSPQVTTSRKTKGKKVQQFKRTCQACGKTWYSLKEREDALNERSGCKYCCHTCFSIGDKSAEMQIERNKEASSDQLAALKQCPDCKSGVFHEIIEDFYE